MQSTQSIAVYAVYYEAVVVLCPLPFLLIYDKTFHGRGTRLGDPLSETPGQSPPSRRPVNRHPQMVPGKKKGKRRGALIFDEISR